MSLSISVTVWMEISRGSREIWEDNLQLASIEGMNHQAILSHSVHSIYASKGSFGSTGLYYKNKPAAQAAGADPSQCNFTTRQNSASPVKLP